MGRWSQARHRGRGNAGGLSFTLPAPVLDVDWSVETGGGSVFGDLVDGFPAGADGLTFNSAINPGVPANPQPWAANPTTLVAEQPDGELVNVNAFWTLSGVQVSPLSDQTQIAVVV